MSEKLENNTITLFDGDEQKQLKILFTYHHEQRNKDFMFLYDESDPDGIFLVEYFEDGTLEIIEDEEILSEAQEVLDAYDDSLDEQE